MRIQFVETVVVHINSHCARLRLVNEHSLGSKMSSKKLRDTFSKHLKETFLFTVH